MPDDLSTEWHIRPADLTDSDVLLHWRNDATVFKWYLNPSAVDAVAHATWFSQRMSGSDPSMWIADMGGVAAGSVRLDIDGGLAYASVVVDPRFHGRGIGRGLLDFIAEQARSRAMTDVRAVIHPENGASLSLFSSAGYELERSNDEGFMVYRLILAG